jgi:nucleotide-binding universal stress UspA family protein
MTLLVPFDGSDLARAALERAVEFGEFTGEAVLVLSVVPDDADYAREVGWVDAGEEFVPELVAGDLERRARRTAPDATFRSAVVGSDDAGVPVTTDVARTIRETAAEVDASVVFVGSENAGRVATPLSSVGKPVSEDPRYDVHIVRHAD